MLKKLMQFQERQSQGKRHITKFGVFFSSASHGRSFCGGRWDVYQRPMVCLVPKRRIGRGNLATRAVFIACFCVFVWFWCFVCKLLEVLFCVVIRFWRAKKYQQDLSRLDFASAAGGGILADGGPAAHAVGGALEQATDGRGLEDLRDQERRRERSVPQRKLAEAAGIYTMMI